ncbi:hypothetical protein HBH92_127860 [Parastagonospora nodorum]|nr:hypothetical protein HBH92_127860 [Parastagonospora nodorum]KAH4426855.1 hypothetical protein HBH93_170320 [Parastagonospora nodorum]KAH4441234.1 hypothetical protein HBH91_169940 [Parastagonospora nodorum]KAH4489733.1 hypothetical protein HBH89_188680 [Parastagonospora nodorum]KAH4539289.1 hypothetical protein HBH85_134760 [Parastagonospora nodorum]
MINGCSRQSISEQPRGKAYTAFAHSFTFADQTTAFADPRRRTFGQNTDLAVRLLCDLPRELRNRVYMFSVQGAYDDEVFVRRPLDANGMNVLLVRQQTSQCSYRWIEDPIHATLTNPALEPETAKEMLEAYYWTRTFKCSHRDLPFLGSFLNTDRYGLGMAPSAYIRRLQVQVQVECVPHAQSSEAQIFTRKTQLCAIQALSEVLTARTEVDIDVVLPGDLQYGCDGSETRCHLAEDMSDIVEMVGCLRKGGVRTTVTHNELCGHWGYDTDNLNSLDMHWTGSKSMKIGKVEGNSQ